MGRYISRLAAVAGIFILSIGVGMLVTQEGGRVPLLPDHVAQASGVYEFTWSPDSKSLAYVSAQGGQPEIWIVDAGGGPARRITSTGLSKRQPRWSGDGKWIAYVAIQAGGPGDIEIVSADGNQIINLTETGGDDTSPVWSPDSRSIAFTETGRVGPRILSVDVESR